MSEPFRGVINIDIKQSTPDWAPYTQPKAPEGAPNLLYIVLDDVGFGAMEPFGGPIQTPALQRIADNGVTCINFHTTALCSPTRSCLITGRNHTTNGMAGITEITDGYPNANGHIPFECANLAEVLGQHGWNTYAVGKWHLTAEDEMNLASSKRQWPLGRGFERYYGFLGGETNQWYPDLIYDNHPVAPPTTPDQGYHLTTDLTDKAIEFIQDTHAIAPDKPFFLYFCPGAAHAPHHVSREWADRYRGKFDMGYEAIREAILARQKELGIVPDSTELSAINPYVGETGPDGQGWPELDTVRPWDSLTAEEKRLFARMAEVYAGFLSHADDEIGRLLGYLDQAGQLDNTIVVVVSDNGASGEGGPNGSVNENKFFNGLPDTIEENLQLLDELGSPRTYNHYPTGWAWAFNTPFKMWKRYGNLRGGTANPLIVSWPAGIQARGGVRRQYCHAIDIVPTLYDALGVGLPGMVNGYPQKPLEGVSFAASFDDPMRTPVRGRSSIRCSAPGPCGTGGGRLPAWGRRRRTRGATSLASGGSCSTPTPTRVSVTTWPTRSPSGCGNSSTCGGSRPGGTRRCRWKPATPSRPSPPHGRSCRKPGPATPTSRAERRCPNRRRPTSAAGPTRSLRRWSSTPRMRAGCCSPRARDSVAMLCTSRRGSWPTPTTSSAKPFRSWNPTSRFPRATSCFRPPSSGRATRCHRGARSACTSGIRRRAKGPS